MNIDQIALSVIEEACADAKKKLIWFPTCKYVSLTAKLGNDGRGKIGEKFVATLLNNNGYEAIWDEKTCGKEYDVLVRNKITNQILHIEVKTATLGNSAPTFQHDDIERNRDYNCMILVEFTPNNVGVICLAKNELPFDREILSSYLPNLKKMTPRKDGTNYHLTVRLKEFIPITTEAEFMEKFCAMESRVFGLK